MESLGHKSVDAAYPLGGHVDRRYRIEAELGRGGMGAVYRAFDEGTGRVVALKLMRRDEPHFVALFEREYRTLSKLAHPRVIAVYDFGCTSEAERYYTMELLAGSDVFACAPVPWLAACGLLRDVCTSLALLHAQRLLHRDVNPRNIRVDQSGRAKLLDFGALTQFGIQDRMIGTPSCTAPEAVRGEALDGRADLFSLGVVAYLTLTGRLPFAIAQFDTAESAWQSAPLPPSQFVAGLPIALDQLVLSLLSIDALARPVSAADVIDRLDAITVTDDESPLSIADSHIASSPLVGQQAQQRELSDLLTRVCAREGAVLDIQGEAGAGKTRLLAELRREAALRGLACLQLSVTGHETRWQVLLALLRGLLEVAPQLTRASTALRAGPLAALLVQLGEVVASEVWNPDAYSATERMSRMELALLAVVLDVARRKPLLVSVDDAQKLPADSAGMLSLLAQSASGCSLLLAAARVPGDCAPAVQQLQWVGTQLRLTALQPVDVEFLVEAAFGAVPHRTRLAQWLWSTSRGHPGQLHTLLHELVAQRIVRYAGGAWLLPAELPELLLSDDKRDQALRRLACHDLVSRSLAQLLAVHHGALPESVLLRAHPDEEPRLLLEALQNLVNEHLTVSHDSQHRLNHESSRRWLLEQLTTEQRAAVHLSLAKALRAHDSRAVSAVLTEDLSATPIDDIVCGVAVGHHFLFGGERELGLNLLRNAAIALTVRGQGLMAAAPYLEAAVELLKRRGDDIRAYSALMTALTLAGTYADWRLSYRYGDDMLDALAEFSGVTMARWLTPYLGGTLALYLGLCWGSLLYFLLPHRRASNKYSELLLGLMGLGSAILGVCPVLQDTVRAQRTIETLRPLHYFPRTHAVYMVHEFQLSLRDSATGHYAEAHARGREVLAYLRSDRAKRSLPQAARFQLEAGTLTMLVQYDSLRTDGSAQHTIAELEALDSPTAAESFAAARAAFYGHRGERQQYVRALEHLDRLAARSGSTWRSDTTTARLLWSTHALCEDVLSLKRLVQQLQSLSSELASVARIRDFAQACYLSERGQAVEALARYGAAFELAWNDSGLRSCQELGAYARILRKAGQPDRARAVCEQALARLGDHELPFEQLVFPLESELVLSLSALREDALAMQLADALLAKHGQHDNQLLRGLSHGVRAQVALSVSDWMVFDREIDAMYLCFQSIQHPALFAQRQRLFEQARVHRYGLSVASAANDQDVDAAKLQDDDMTTQ